MGKRHSRPKRKWGIGDESTFYRPSKDINKKDSKNYDNINELGREGSRRPRNDKNNLNRIVNEENDIKITSNQAIQMIEQISRPNQLEKKELMRIKGRVSNTVDKIFTLDPEYKQYNFGSSKDFTQISPISDFDITIVLDANQYGFLANNLIDLNTSKVALEFIAGMLRREYGNELEYCEPNINTVKIKFKDSFLPVDIEIGFRNDNSPDFGNILIPDTNLMKFKQTNTILNDNLLTKANKKSGYKLKPNIRTFKVFNKKLNLGIDSTYIKSLFATKSSYNGDSLNQLKHSFDLLNILLIYYHY